MSYTYQQIKPLVTKHEVNGNQVNVFFKSSDQDAPIQSMAIVMPEQKELMTNVGKSAVKRGVVSGVVSWLGRLLGSSIGGAGGAVAGSVASSAGNQVAQTAMGDPSKEVMKVNMTPEKIEAAIVQAFQSVAHMYQMDEATNTWKAVKHG